WRGKKGTSVSKEVENKIVQNLLTKGSITVSQGTSTPKSRNSRPASPPRATGSVTLAKASLQKMLPTIPKTSGRHPDTLLSLLTGNDFETNAPPRPTAGVNDTSSPASELGAAKAGSRSKSNSKKCIIVFSIVCFLGWLLNVTYPL
ncbi:hypothetical protein PSTT_08054, partial [Puccinia striiformis]